MIAAVRTAEQVPDEELWRRAEARSVAAAALFFGDVRMIKNVAGRTRSTSRNRGRVFGLLRVRRPWLVIAARDALSLRRNPGLAITAGVFVAAAFTAAVAAIDRPIFGVGTFIGLYAAASRLLEPVRLEADRPAAHRMLPWSWGTGLALHCIVPTITLTALGWAAIAVVGIGGFIPGSAVSPLLAIAPFAAAALVAPAATSAVRGPFPVETLISGAESSSLILVIWLVVAPVLAAIIANIAFSILRPTLEQGITAATLNAAMFLTAATLGVISWLATRKAPD